MYQQRRQDFGLDYGVDAFPLGRLSDDLADVRYDKRKRFSTKRLQELLDVQPDEEPYLVTLCSEDIKEALKKENDRLSHRKICDRAAYEGQAQEKRERVSALRSQGLTYRQIAEQMGLTVNAVDKLLRSR